MIKSKLQKALEQTRKNICHSDSYTYSGGIALLIILMASEEFIRSKGLCKSCEERFISEILKPMFGDKK